jgi:hypothetical protein
MEIEELLQEPTAPVEEMRSKTIGTLAEALAKAQLKFKPIKKQVENAFYTTEKKKAMYADLAAIIEATQGALAENGLVVIQLPVIRPSQKAAGVQSLLVHTSGEWLKNEVILPATERRKEYDAAGKAEYKDQFNAQSCGKAITYSRRYSYGSIIGVAAEEDDDGNSISIKENGSVEAAKAVGERKVAAMKQRVAQQVTEKEVESNGASESLEASGEVYGILKQAKKIKNGKAMALQIVDPNDQTIVLFCFDDKKYPFGSSLFTLLELAAEGNGQSIRGRIKQSGKYTNLVMPIAVGSVNFDDDGVPMLDRTSA